jgi:secreted Zn-dependent insulinase-like peptidase
MDNSMSESSNNNIEYKIEQILKIVGEDVKIVKSRDSSVYKFERDHLDYVKKTLDNGLQILFIEDDLAVSSEVYMSVSAGHNHNPLEFEGLAHFLEHMLFIGSKKYPDSTLYNRLVSESHGSANAYTADDHTMYYFTCRSDLIFNILDVFCNFFVEPLLDPKYVEKEVSAVDHEHQKNIGSDNFRMWSLIDTFITDEINSRFRTGTRSTLQKEGVVDALKQLYNNYYTVDRMMLVVVHNRLDDEFIQKTSQVFSSIPNRKSKIAVEAEKYPVGLRRVDGYEMVRAKRMTDGHMMTIRFFLSDTVKNRKIVDRADHILSYILNHRGRKSLHKLMADLGLIQGMSGTSGSLYTDEMGYDIVMTLTDYGFENYQNALLILLAYLNKIRSNASEIFDTYYRESHEIDVMNLNTMDRITGSDAADMVNGVYNTFGTDLQYIRVLDLLEDVVEIRRHFVKMLDEMIKELDLRMKVILMSHSFDESKLPEVDTYYHTKYSKTDEKFNPDELSKFFDIKYRLPEINPYLPDSFEVLVPIATPKFESQRTDDMTKIDDPNEYIRLGSDVGNFYHLLKTNNYDSHHAYGSFKISLSSLSETLNPIDALIIEFYIRLVMEEHKPEIFLSSVAGSSISIGSNFRGINIGFRTFDSSLGELVANYLGWFFKERLEIDAQAYARIYKNIRDYLVNYEKAEPYTRFHQTLIEFVTPQETISNSQLLYVIQLFDPKLMKDESSEINFSNLQSRAWELMRKGSVRGVMAGSLRLSTAQKVVMSIDALFEHQREFRIRRIKNEILNSDDAGESGYTETIHTVQNKNERDKNIGLLYTIHLGEYVRSEYDPENNYREIREPVAYYAVSSMIRERFFNTMRTENELGYYVRAGMSAIENSGAMNLFMKFEIQTQDEDIVDTVREYVDQELINIVHEFNNEELQSYVKNSIDHTFSDPSNMIEKFNDGKSIQSNLTYEELENIGDTVYLNRLRSLDGLVELNKLTVEYIHNLLEGAIRDRPRYLVKILPKN